MSAQIIDLLIKYEKTISSLYSVCAQQFPDQAAFWNKLSSEEDRHALVITKLARKIDNKTLFLEDNRFKIRPLEISLEYAEEVIGKIKTGNVALLEALSIAYSIESSILEAKYYELFAGDSVSLNHYLKQLQKESADHRNRVRELLEIKRRENNPGQT